MRAAEQVGASAGQFAVVWLHYPSGHALGSALCCRTKGLMAASEPCRAMRQGSHCMSARAILGGSDEGVMFANRATRTARPIAWRLQSASRRRRVRCPCPRAAGTGLLPCAAHG